MGGIVHDRSVSAVCAGAVFLWMFCAVQPVKAEPPFAGLEDRVIVLESILGTLIDQYCEDGSVVSGINSDGTLQCAEIASEESDFKFVFVSSEKYTGDLGGLTGADEKCQALATAARLPGDYKAWLSDDSESPSSRFVMTNPDIPYMLPDGETKVADGWGALVDGLPLHHINQNEYGMEVDDLHCAAWTNTTSSGTMATDDLQYSCNAWTSAAEEYKGLVGVYRDLGGYDWIENWTLFSMDGGYYTCDWSLRVYCFQQ